MGLFVYGTIVPGSDTMPAFAGRNSGKLSCARTELPRQHVQENQLHVPNPNGCNPQSLHTGMGILLRVVAR